MLIDLLSKQFPAATDFGRGILPAVIGGERRVVAFPHAAYWEDVGAAPYCCCLFLGRGGGSGCLGAGLFVFSPPAVLVPLLLAWLPPCLLPAKRTERTAAEPHSATVTPTNNNTPTTH